MIVRVAAMNGDDFEVLVAAYGGDPERWPEKARASALSFADTVEGQQVLASALELDDALKRYETCPPSSALYATILVSGTRQLRPKRWRLRLGLGALMCGLGVAGGLAGAAAVMTIIPEPSITSNEPATAFGDLQTDRSLGEQ
jgi:hypothetical protein